MRNLHLLDAYRLTGRDLSDYWEGYAGDGTCGAFAIPSPVDKSPLAVIASSDLGWEHVSVSRKNRCPNWTEMSYIASLFFKDDETAMQLHVPRSDHVNDHPFCLHWWRPTTCDIPRPPQFMVGGMTLEQAEAAAKEYTL